MLTLERLRHLTEYDNAAGGLRWTAAIGKRNAGRAVGSAHSRGYVHTVVDQTAFFVHRLVWFYCHGRWPVGDIDHINGNRKDNRIENLRECSRAENLQNRAARKLIGSSRAGKRFRAQIMAAGETRHLGMFDSAEEAHEAYLKAKIALHTFSPTPRGSAC